MPAARNLNPKVGDIVYPSSTPVHAGYIEAIVPGRLRGETLARIVTCTGKRLTENVLNLRDFLSLIDDHANKARNHRQIFDAISRLRDEAGIVLSATSTTAATSKE